MELKSCIHGYISFESGLAILLCVYCTANYEPQRNTEWNRVDLSALHLHIKCTISVYYLKTGFVDSLPLIIADLQRFLGDSSV